MCSQQMQSRALASDWKKSPVKETFSMMLEEGLQGTTACQSVTALL